ncbi:MAG: cytochrome P450 [Anaerolineae bacterium]
MAIDTVNPYKIWDARQDPHSVYHQIRANEPVYRAIGPVSGNTFWFITRYADCVAALKDARLTRSWLKIASETDREAALQSPEAALGHHMLNVDPPEHTRLRRLVHKAFTPRMIAQMRDDIETIANDLIDRMDPTTDLISAYAFPVPVTVIAELLGIPVEDQDEFGVWSKTLIYEGDQMKRAVAAMEMIRYFRVLFEQRKAEPRDDLISALVAVEEEGDQLTMEELLSMVFLLLAAGHETTVNLIGNGVITLLDHPDQLERLRAEPERWPDAIEEILRYQGPVENTLSRWALEDIPWDGVTIRRGDTVMVSVMAANRAPAVFQEPDRFDITREPNKHIAFGNGIHYCLGAPLARLEGTIALQTLFERLPDLRITADELTWNPQIIFRGVGTLPVATQ